MTFSEDYFFGGKDTNYANYDYFDNDRYWKPIISLIEKYKMRGKVLDIGCAFGFFLKRVRPYFDEIYGLDISRFAIERAKKEVPSAKLRVVDLNNDGLPYPDEYFDLITAFDVLEHTESIEKSLRKIIRKLDKNGYLIISVPLKDTWAGKIFRLFDKDISHISIPSRKELFNIINKVGLEVIEQSYFANFRGIFRIKGVPVDIEIVLQKM